MKFEMYASEQLLSEYVFQYLNDIKFITKQWETKRFHELKINYYNLLDNLCGIIEAHYATVYGKAKIPIKELRVENIEIKLNECLYAEPYTEEELNHIYINEDYRRNAYLEIAIKRFLFKLYGTKDVNKIIKKFENELRYSKKSSLYTPFIEMLKQDFEDKNVLMQFLFRRFNKNFTWQFNCGGYALEIFEWVSCHEKDPDATVSKILYNPSVRLLGETLLQEDEYLVVLDAKNYHFIKCKEGKFIEKMRTSPYQRI